MSESVCFIMITVEFRRRVIKLENGRGTTEHGWNALTLCIDGVVGHRNLIREMVLSLPIRLQPSFTVFPFILANYWKCSCPLFKSKT
jgi:hypothetical protein